MTFSFSPLPLRWSASAITLVFVLAGCRGSSVREAGHTPDHDGGNNSEEPPISDTPFATDDANELFDASAIPVFEVAIAESRWEFMQANPTLEQYESGHLTYNGESIGEVGIRYKGSVGSLTGCVDDEGALLPECDKLSFKLKFSEFDKNQRFYKMKRLNFHGMARDRSKLHEKVAYKVYRDAGINAPRTTWARLEINGESQGLFSLVEQIDGRFTASRWLDEGDGNLFKEIWPISDDPDDYIDRLKTNEEAADVSAYLAFSAAMNSSAEEDYLETLQKWTDLEQLYAYIAVNDAIANWDGITAFYCGDWGCGNHNFYMYQHELEDRFTLIPWDLDNTLTPSTPHDNVPHWTDPGDCDVRYPVFGGWVDTQSAGCNNIFAALNSDRKRYEAAIDEVLSGPFDIERIEKEIDDYVDLISEEVENDPFLDGAETWMLEVQRLKDDLALLKMRVEAFRDGTELSPLTIGTSSTLDFENAHPLQLVVGNSYWASPGTSTDFFLNMDSPLGGTKDARLEFVYRDQGTEPWSQWIGWIWNVSAEETDFSSSTGIRLTVQADQDRNVRLDLESPFQPGAQDGARLGWEFTAGDTPATVELEFTDAAIPTWATSAGEQLDEVLTHVSSIIISPGAIRGADGLIGEGLDDPGSFQLDDIEIY